MRQRGKYGRLIEADRLEIADRIRGGQTHAEVAAAIGCSTKSIQRLLNRTGGLTPQARNRSPRQLTAAEREEISRGLKAGDSYRAIPDQTLEARGEAATVDLAAYFEDVDGEALAFRASSSDTAVVRTAAAGPVLTLTPVSAGSVVVSVSAEDAAGESAMQAFGVAVGRNRMERVVLEETLAAMARSQLASARMAVGGRGRGPDRMRS